MSASVIECIENLLKEATPVLKLNELRDDIWYRKPKGARKGPWLSAKYTIEDQTRWSKNDACIYFVISEEDELKYVGISNNKLKDRWRTSPAYDANDNSLYRDELFHSQCWPAICAEYAKSGKQSYTVSVLHSSDLIDVLSKLDHEVSALGTMKNDGDIAVIAMEVWIVKYFGNDLWNKRK